MATPQQKTTYSAAEVAALEETILKLKTENDELRRKLEHMNEIFADAQRARFGQSSEKNTYLQHVVVQLPYLGKTQSHKELELFMPWAPYIQQEFGVKDSDAYVNTYLD